MLVRRTFVAINGEALVNDLSSYVTFLSEGFHDELLKIAGKELQSIFVGEHDHVFAAMAIGRVIPHERELGGGVGFDVALAGNFVTSRGASEQLVNVDALQRGWKQTNGGGFAGAATDPIPHWKSGEPFFFLGELVESAAPTSNGDGMI